MKNVKVQFLRLLRPRALFKFDGKIEKVTVELT
jgi:hypothetical protein